MRHWPGPTVLMFTSALILALPARAQQKPFTQDQVQGMVRDGLGDETGAKAIGQRGIDFTPSEHLIQALKAAGATEAFLKALRSAKPPEPASAKKPINQVQVFALLVGQVPSHRVAMLIQERGVDFEPTDDYLQEVRLAGGEDELITALKSATVTRPVTVDPAAQARQAEVRQHVARAGEFYRNKRFADAEVEVRAALREAPDDAELHDDLAGLLGDKGDWDGEIAEAHEAVHLNPDDDGAYVNLGVALEKKGDGDAAITEFREALRLNPNNANAAFALGLVLANKGDWDGAILEYREALRMNPPNSDVAHYVLGVALGNKGDQGGAMAEYRKAYVLDPREPLIRQAYAQALADSWPSLIINREGPLPTTWSDVWGFYVKLWTPPGVLGGLANEQCIGELEVGNGRIKFSCPREKFRFDAALSDVKDARREENIYGDGWNVLITFSNTKKTKTVEFEATDRLGGNEESGPLLDAILQAIGR